MVPPNVSATLNGGLHLEKSEDEAGGNNVIFVESSERFVRLTTAFPDRASARARRTRIHADRDDIGVVILLVVDRRGEVTQEP